MGAVCVAALLVGACGDKSPGSAQVVPAAGLPAATLLGGVVATCADAAGPIEVRRSGATYWEPAAVGVTLRDGDWIRSGDGGSARVRLLAGGHLDLGARSALLIARDATPAALASSVEGTAVAVPDEPPPAEPTEPATVASTDTGTYTDVDPPPSDDPVAPARPRPARPRAPRLPYPQSVSPGVDARVACKPSIALTWRAVPEAAGYRVSIGRDLTFKSIVKFVELRGGKKTTYAFKPLAAGTYAWRVAARGRDGRYGEYGFARRVRCTP
ncbi:MAG TPA: hypothetical protein VMZ28_04025 [Kofleriaceae bacterium]|nr:hypothetical protein [Kofleriaceae bacterium]